SRHTPSKQPEGAKLVTMAKLAAALAVLALLGCMARECQADYGHPSPPPTPCSPGHHSTPPSTASPPSPAPVPSPPASAELVVGYYQKTCHRAEDIVRETVRGANA
uniref:Pectinesterase inhibitor domain-containing protein n=1 Tax=Aegilops tauschii subsp. strangulata TaxID=200361 RepID=A0A453AYN8_AEGTS